MWLDLDASAIDEMEPGIQNVVVVLHNSSGDIARTTTDANGYYRFDGLAAGEYQVCILAITIPSGLEPTRGNDNPNDNIDFDSNGVYSGNGALCTAVVKLGPNPDEPTGEKAPSGQGSLDNQANMTIDFGLRFPHSLGNRVWLDSNANGRDDSEPAVGAQVTLGLYNSAGALLRRTQTDTNGYYRFDGLAPAQYFVCVDTRTLPSDLRSTAPDATNPDDNVDFDDNGRMPVQGTANEAQGVCSSLITIGPGEVEPTGELAPNGQGVSKDSLGNMTLDFGFVRHNPTAILTTKLRFTGSYSQKMALVAAAMALLGLALVFGGKRRKFDTNIIG